MMRAWIDERDRGALWTGAVLVVAVALLGIASLAGCNGEDSEEEEKPSGFCIQDSDCGEDEECVGGVCRTVEPVGCFLHGCDDHEFCDTDAECKASAEKPCEGDDDCGEDFFCPPSVGLCLERCLVATDCALDMSCNNAVGGCMQCTFDPDCEDHPDGSYCFTDEGRCVECTETVHCEHGSFCDLEPGSESRHSCVQGCLDDDDCSPEASCERPGDGPGRCVECRPETAAEDCTDPRRQRCHPVELTCVSCFEHGQCTDPNSGWCHPETFTCVQCLLTSHCPMGMVCVEGESVCEAGCDGDHRCPPEASPHLIHCHDESGPLGACVECLDGEHCPPTWNQGFTCRNSVCVEGCSSDADCPEDYGKCDLAADECVKCLDDADCPEHLHCDVAKRTCGCIDQGSTTNRCDLSDECGNPAGWPDVPWWDGECHDQVWCVTEVQCENDQWKDISGRCGDTCMAQNFKDVCPDGYCCRRVRNAEFAEPPGVHNQGLKCVPMGQCGTRCR